MYELLTILQIVVLVAILFVIAHHYRASRPAAGASQRPSRRAVRALEEMPTRYEAGDRREAERERYRFLNLPGIQAGTVLHGVPAINPLPEGSWSGTREVVTLARIVAHPDDGGTILTDFLELGGGYALAAAMGQAAILKFYPLSAAEERYLDGQRRDALEKSDAVIEDFQGKRWEIRTACGKGRRGIQDTFQVLSQLPPGSETPASVLPSEVRDRREHAYFDLRARSEDGDYLFAFWVEGAWLCFLGRILEPAERAGLAAV